MCWFIVIVIIITDVFSVMIMTITAMATTIKTFAVVAAAVVSCS